MPVVIMGIVAGFGYFLGNLKERKLNRLRFLSFLLLPFCFLPFESISLMFLLLPPCGYLITSISLKQYYINFSKTREQIKLSLMLIFAPLIIALFGGYEYLVATYYFQYILLFLGCAICLLRALLNDWQTISKPKFILYNIGFISGIFIILIIVGSPFVMRVLFSVGQLILRYIVLPILFAIRWLVIFISSLLSTYEDREITFLEFLVEEPAERFGFGAPNYLGGFFSGVPETVWWLFIIFTILLLMFIIARVIKAIRVGKKRNSINWEGIVEEQNIGMTKDEKKKKSKRLFAPKDARLAIRYYYGRFLKMCIEKGIPPQKGNTTREICINNKEVFSEGTMNDLRELYIKARYSEKEILKSETERSKELLKYL
jgi:hypothetical protein